MLFNTATRVWLHGLVAAFIGAFATAASGCMTLPTVFNFTHDGLFNILKLTVAPAMIAVFAYLQKSPLPPLIEAGDQATIQNPIISTDGTITGDSATLQKAPIPPTASKQ